MRAIGVVLLVLCAAPAGAQWLNYKAPGLPRTPDGKVKMTAPAPRTADGRTLVNPPLGMGRMRPTKLGG